MLTTWKLQKAQLATLKEQKLLLLKGSFTIALELAWLVRFLGHFWEVPWPNEALTYLQAPQEVFRTFKGSLKIKNNLEAPTLVYVQGYVQDDFGRFYIWMAEMKSFPSNGWKKAEA